MSKRERMEKNSERTLAILNSYSTIIHLLSHQISAEYYSEIFFFPVNFNEFQ